MALKLEDWTPSDSGAWRTEYPEDGGRPHVMPLYGPKHELSMSCWCHPVLDNDYETPAVSHNVAH